jgi:hypothetical protein
MSFTSCWHAAHQRHELMRSQFAHRVCFTALLAADNMLRTSDTSDTNDQPVRTPRRQGLFPHKFRHCPWGCSNMRTRVCKVAARVAARESRGATGARSQPQQRCNRAATVLRRFRQLLLRHTPTSHPPHNTWKRLMGGGGGHALIGVGGQEGANSSFLPLSASRQAYEPTARSNGSDLAASATASAAAATAWTGGGIVVSISSK